MKKRCTDIYHVFVVLKEYCQTMQFLIFMSAVITVNDAAGHHVVELQLLQHNELQSNLGGFVGYC